MAGTERAVLLIEELDDNRKTLRSLELRGGGLPVWGSAWEGDADIVTTWYPGNQAEATQQVLGGKEMPSTWTGQWNINVLASEPSVYTDEGGVDSNTTSPQFLMEVFDDLRMRGRRLRVSFIQQSVVSAATGRIVREGRLKRFKISVQDLSLLDWEAEFHWVGRGGTSQKVTSTRADAMPSAVAALAVATDAMQKAITDAESTNTRVHRSATKFTLGQLESLAKAPGKLSANLARSVSHTLSQVQQVGRILTTLKNAPYAVANNALGAARQAVEVCNQFQDQLSRTPAELLSAQNKVSDIARAQSHFGKLGDSSVVMARVAQELEDKARAQASAQARSGTRAQASVKVTSGGVSQDMLGVYVTKRGDTPESVSVHYYRTPDHAVDIMKANRLPWHTAILKPGTPLFIPALPTSKGF